MTRNLVLSKHTYEWTLLDFSLQCKLELENWCRARRKIYWDSLRELVVNSDPKSELKTAKKPLFLNSHSNSLEKVTFVTVKRKSTWHKLIPVDTSWHWVHTELLCAYTQQVVGGCIGTYTLSLMVIIVSDHERTQNFSCTVETLFLTISFGLQYRVLQTKVLIALLNLSIIHWSLTLETEWK